MSQRCKKAADNEYLRWALLCSGALSASPVCEALLCPGSSGACRLLQRENSGRISRQNSASSSASVAAATASSSSSSSLSSLYGDHKSLSTPSTLGDQFLILIFHHFCFLLFDMFAFCVVFFEWGISNFCVVLEEKEPKHCRKRPNTQGYLSSRCMK